MSFDISQYELQDTCVVTLKDASGELPMLGTDGKPVTAVIFSPGSEEGVAAVDAASRSATARMYKGMRGENDPKDAEKARKAHALKLTSITKGFSDNFPVAPAAVFSNPRLPHIHRQIDAAFDALGNFSKGSSPS